MTLAILVAPTGAAPAPVESVSAPSPWYRVGMTWTGANGLSFDLISRSGVTLLLDDVKGLLNPPFQQRTSATPSRGGSRLRDVTTGERDVFWPMLVWTDAGSAAWQNLNDAFFSTLSAEFPGTWTVTRADGTQRRLSVYITDDGSTLGRDPQSVGWARYPITGVALDPWWYGEEVHRTFKQPGVTGTLAGPGRPIGSRSTVDRATIDNPGDVPSYPRWVITGPVTSVTVGVTIDGVVRNIVAPITLTAGQTLTIDTESHSVRDSTGTSRRSQLTSAYFVPIPPGKDIPLSMTMTGTGLVECYLPTRYKRAI